jgi:hypothetical protein
MLEMREKHRSEGLLTLGASDDLDLLNLSLEDLGQRAPLMIISKEDISARTPLNQVQCFAIDGSGHIVALDNHINIKLKASLCLEHITPYGRWMLRRQPYFPNPSPNRKIVALEHQINQGKVIVTLNKAERMTEETDREDQPTDTALRAKNLIQECADWVAFACALESEALAAGDLVTAHLICEQLEALYKRDPVGDEAETRRKALEALPAWPVAKEFYTTWSKDWGKPAELREKNLRAFLDQHPEGYYHDLVKGWLEKPTAEKPDKKR